MSWLPAVSLRDYVPTYSSLARLLPFLNYIKPSPEAIRRHLYFGPPGCTFSNEDALPRLPVPDLADTLRAYLESCKPHLEGEEELRELEATLAEFERGVGAELQAKLEERAASSKNWLEQWWADEAYLKQRLPMIPYNSMFSVEPNTLTHSEDFDLEMAYINLHFIFEFWKLLRKERIKPQEQLKRGPKGENLTTPLSMDQFRRMFHTIQLPKTGKDEIVSHFTTEAETGHECPNNMLVMYRGHAYSVQVADWHPDGGCEVMTPPELERAFRWILADVRGRTPTFGPGVPALTNDDRDAWADNRRRLVELDPGNAELLRLAEFSLMAFGLLDAAPEDETAMLRLLLTGANARDCWADKTFSVTACRNGIRGTGSAHSPLDGMVNATVYHFVLLSQTMIGYKWPTNRVSAKEWPDPRRLDFVIDEKLEADIKRISGRSQEMSKMLNMQVTHFRGFGKRLLKEHRTHPDAFVQAAVHLAYYKLHGRPGSAYESAATRKFFHGRTETCRTCTVEAVDFVKAMTNPTVQRTEKWRLLKLALDKHQQLMKKANENRGCDRHLFGLQMVASESGVQDPLIPKVFGPGPYMKSGGNGNFVLSTSLLGYTEVLAGAIPMCHGGYGLFYTIDDDGVHYTVSAWTGGENDVDKMQNLFEESLVELEGLAAEQAKS